jgi:hypothetical protein
VTTDKRTEKPTAEPCKACPWRIDNHGKRHPDGWYTKANRTRLWSGLRRGEQMSCHPTDPRNPVSERAQKVGYSPAPDASQVRRCAGGEILQQRELQLISDMKGDVPAYREARPGGLTKDGIGEVLSSHMFGQTLKVDLNAPVGHGGDKLPWQKRSST